MESKKSNLHRLVIVKISHKNCILEKCKALLK